MCTKYCHIIASSKGSVEVPERWGHNIPSSSNVLALLSICWQVVAAGKAGGQARGPLVQAVKNSLLVTYSLLAASSRTCHVTYVKDTARGEAAMHGLP